MDSMQNKISGIFDMVATMRDSANPAPQDRYLLPFDSHMELGCFTKFDFGSDKS